MAAIQQATQDVQNKMNIDSEATLSAEDATSEVPQLRHELEESKKTNEKLRKKMKMMLDAQDCTDKELEVSDVSSNSNEKKK